MPCPHGVLIPSCFTKYNDYAMYEDDTLFLNSYKLLGDKNAAACVNCKICETKCPQNIKIGEEMLTINEVVISITK